MACDLSHDRISHSTDHVIRLITIDMPASQGVLMWAMGVGFVASFVLTGWHAHFALHLGPGYTLVAMMAFVGAVLAGLLLNLWFMAGQRYVLEFLAWYEPTSGIAEWVHDTVFGVPQDRIDAAYRAGSHRGRCELAHVFSVCACVFEGRCFTRECLPALAGGVLPVALCCPCHFGLSPIDLAHTPWSTLVCGNVNSKVLAGAQKTASRTCSSSSRAEERLTHALWAASCTFVFSLPGTRLTLINASARSLSFSHCKRPCSFAHALLSCVCQCIAVCEYIDI